MSIRDFLDKCFGKLLDKNFFILLSLLFTVSGGLFLTGLGVGFYLDNLVAKFQDYTIISNKELNNIKLSSINNEDNLFLMNNLSKEEVKRKRIVHWSVSDLQMNSDNKTFLQLGSDKPNLWSLNLPRK